MTRRFLAAFACLFISVAPLHSDDAAPEAKPEPQYKNMPWHLVDHWWDLGADQKFESLSIDVIISEDVPSSVRLYVAPVGLAHLSKTPFYGGIQTMTDATTKTDPKIRNIGPGFLFSMWGARTFDAIRPSEGGFCQSSGHEGDFVSVRRPFEWKKGKYTFKLIKMDREVVDGQPHTWVGNFIYNHATDSNIFVGALRFPGEDLVLDRKVANFVEIYGRRRPVSEIPKLTVTFFPPVVNGVPSTPLTAEAIYPQGVPDYAESAAKDGAIEVTVGQPVEGREKRRAMVIDNRAK